VARREAVLDTGNHQSCSRLGFLNLCALEAENTGKASHEEDPTEYQHDSVKKID